MPHIVAATTPHAPKILSQFNKNKLKSSNIHFSPPYFWLTKGLNITYVFILYVAVISKMEKPERFIVTPFYDDGQILDTPRRHSLGGCLNIRVYKSRTRAEKRFKELIEEYEVDAKMTAWYPDFRKSKSGRFVTIKEETKRRKRFRGDC